MKDLCVRCYNQGGIDACEAFEEFTKRANAILEDSVLAVKHKFMGVKK